MEKVYKRLKITRIVLYILIAVFLLAQFWQFFFVYLAGFCAAMLVCDLAIFEILRYIELKARIEGGFDVYLAEHLENGFITKEQRNNPTKEMFKEYKKMFRAERIIKILTFVAYFGFSATMITLILRVIL